jgi:hypothetical protein
MSQQLAVGDQVAFTLGETPMIGKIAAAVQLPSGTEIVIDLDTIK